MAKKPGGKLAAGSGGDVVCPAQPERLGGASAYSAIGSALSATGLGLAAIPVVMGMRVAEARVSARINLGDNLQGRTAELNQLRTGA